MAENRQTTMIRFGCLGLFLIFYVLPMALGVMASPNIPVLLFIVMLTLLVVLQFGIPTSKKDMSSVRRLKYVAVMGSLLSVAFILLWIASGVAGGTFTYELSAGLGVETGEAGSSIEIEQAPAWPGRIIFGIVGVLIGGVTLWLGIPYGKKLFGEAKP